MALPSIDDIKAIAGGAKRETKEYEVRGVVTKVGGGIAYVRFEGSDIDTPIDASTASVKVGDEVSVHVSHGDTHITGNRTDPAASSADLEQVRSKVSLLDAIVNVKNSVVNIVDSAFEIISSRIRVRDNVLELLDENEDVSSSFGTGFVSLGADVTNKITMLDEKAIIQAYVVNDEMNRFILSSEEGVDIFGYNPSIGQPGWLMQPGRLSVGTTGAEIIGDLSVSRGFSVGETLHLSDDTYGRMAFDSSSTGSFRIPTCVWSANGGSGNVTLSTSTKKVPVVSTPVYNMSTGIFSYNNGGVKVSVGGWYLVSASVGFTGVTSGDNCTMYVYRDGTNMHYAQSRPAGNSCSVGLTRLMWADAGSTFYLYGANQSAARGSMIGTSYYTTICISAVG